MEQDVKGQNFILKSCCKDVAVLMATDIYMSQFNVYVMRDLHFRTKKALILYKQKQFT